jgi:hypothetical protein
MKEDVLGHVLKGQSVHLRLWFRSRDARGRVEVEGGGWSR